MGELGKYWGIWNGITPPRDAEATRRVATIERAIAPFLISKDWEPLAPMLHYGVFASRWPLYEQTVWTVVNRNEYDVDGQQIELPAEAGMHYFDLYRGSELTPERNSDGKIVLSFRVEAHGYGALLASKTAPDAGIQTLMSKMKEMTANRWRIIPMSGRYYRNR